MSKSATMHPPKRSKSSTNVRPLHDKILVRRDEALDRTKSGIYLPEKAKDTPKTGIVEAVGTGTINTDTGALIPLTVKKGDRVIFSSYAGTELKLGPLGGAGAEDKLLIMSEEEILAVID